MIGFVDTNVALRYLWGDEPDESQAARALIEESPAGSLYLSEVIAAEVVWSMHRRYTREEVAQALEQLLSNESLVFDEVLPDAVLNYAVTNLDFADCVLAARGQRSGVPVISYDRGYKQLAGLRFCTPVEFLALS